MNHTNRSPTESQESRTNWARKESLILKTLHETHPPTHEAVVKFTMPMSVRSLKAFQTRFRQNVCNWSKREGVDMAIYYTREIERSNCVHYHLLIRTLHPKPSAVLRPIVASSSQGKATLRHLEQIRNAEATSRYILKYLESVRSGEKEVLLFRNGLGLHLSGAWNGYFVRSKRLLWEEWKIKTYRSSPPAHAGKLIPPKRIGLH